MAAMDSMTGRLLHVSDRRKEFRLYAMAAQPFARNAWTATIVILIGLVGGAAMTSIQMGGQDPPAWVVNQLDDHSKRIDRAEETARENTRGRSVLEQRLTENDRLHARLESLRLEEQLATLNIQSRALMWLTGIQLLGVLGLLIDVFGRRILGARKDE